MANTMLLYKEIKTLNREEHRNLKLKEFSHYEFAAQTHLVPVAGVELLQLARHYPILFVGEGKEVMPVALLGLQEGKNSYLDADFKWRTNVYVPAFIRRYPFVMSQDDESNFTVCFDRDFSGWNQEEGRDLFNDKAENSAFLEEMIQLMQSFTAEMERTKLFVSKLQDLGLLTSKSLQLTHTSGQSFMLRDFLAVDEEKFAKLSDKKVIELHKAGFLPWIYAHFVSLGNVNDLFVNYLQHIELAEVGSTIPS